MFDQTHRLHLKPILESDWVVVYDNTLDYQDSTQRKFAQRWFDAYVVVIVHENGTYSLQELDGISIQIPIVRKWVKAF